MNTKNDNKNVQLLKDKMWARRTTAEVIMLKRNKTTDNLDVLKGIQRNNTREHRVDQVLKKKDGLIWE